MNWETVLSVISLIVSIFSLLFFSLFPYLKKMMINKSFIRIENFYNIYAYLNPCFLGQNQIKNITLKLTKQSFLAKGFPKYNYLMEKHNFNFDPFKLQNTSWNDKLTFREILYFHKFWKLSLKKLNHIKKVINKYEYIVCLNKYNEYENDVITYKDSFFDLIEKSSISLCPSFDSIKLHGSFLTPTHEYCEQKINLLKVAKFKSNKEFIKELKSKTFAINLLFTNKNANENMRMSYSIIFQNKTPSVDIETFFDKHKIEPSDENKQKIKDNLNWIYKTFNIKSPL